MWSNVVTKCVDAALTMWSHASMTPLNVVYLFRFSMCLGYINTCEINCLVEIKMDFFPARSEKVPKDTQGEEDEV